MKTIFTPLLAGCFVFFTQAHLLQAQTAPTGETKTKVESKAAAERAFDAVVNQDRKSNLALTYTPRGTGQTTGHIITITVQNVGSTPVQLVATGKTGLDALAFVDDHIGEASNMFNLQGKYENGLIDIDCSMAYIPSDGKHQSYVATESKLPPGIAEGSGTPNEHGQTPITSINPGESVVIPVHGYCADIRRPPVPSGIESTPVSSWIPPGDVRFPGSDELQNQEIQTVDAPSGGGPYLANIPGDIDPGAGQTIVLTSKTDPAITAAFLFDAIDRITITTDILQDAGLLNTPFSGKPAEERPAVIQQAFWLYSSVLNGDTYTNEEFSERMTTQYEENTGNRIKDAAPEVQERLESGVDDFWGSFNLVGTQAKVIKDTGMTQSNIPPDIQDKIERELGKQDISNVTTRADASKTSASDQMGAHATAEGNKVVTDDSRNTSAVAEETAHVHQASVEGDPEDDSEEKKKCKCQSYSADVVTVNGDKDALDAITPAKKTTSVSADVSKAGNFPSSSEFEVDYEYSLEKGDAFTIEVKNIELDCECEGADCPDLHARSTEVGLAETSAGKHKVKHTSKTAKILGPEEGSEDNSYKATQETDGSAIFELHALNNKKKVTETLHFQISAYCSSDDCARDLCVYDFKLKIKINQ